ncbi:MAG: hypothetical protein AAGF11_13895 [Myxococcota bacterium]
MGLKPPTSKRLRDAARDLLDHPDVVGVMWGDRSKRGRWIDEPCVSVHVLRKQHRSHVAPERRLPRTLMGHRVDVVDVGRPRAHWLGHTDEVTARGLPGAEPRRSTATLYFTDDDGLIHGLLCGHGVLPMRGRRILRAYDIGGRGRRGAGRGRNSRARVQVVDDRAGFYSGHLLRGRCDADEDWALASFPLGKRDDLDAHHLAAGALPPIPRRRGSLVRGAKVWHYSRIRGRHKRFGGIVRQVGLAGVNLLLPDDTDNRYVRVLSVSGGQGKDFSVPGDSGSLVVDDRGRAVGTVIGGSADGKLSYVLGLQRIESVLGDLYAKAFR